MAELKNTEVWEAVRRGLPKTPSEGMDVLPVPEMLRVIEYCLDGRVEDFETAYRLAKKLVATNDALDVLNWYASVCYEAKKYKESYETCQKILAIMPSSGTYFNTSRAAHRAGYSHEAEVLIRKAMAFGDASIPLQMDLSVYVSAQGRFDEALSILQSIDEHTLSQRDRHALDANKGWHFIRLGEFKKGIQLLTSGRYIGAWGAGNVTLQKPLWDGATYTGATILIVGEGGIGDEIIVARFAQVIRERGMRVVMSTVHGLQSVLSRVAGIEYVVDRHALSTFTDYDYFIPGMDLVAALAIDEHEIPSAPYITADASYVKKWSKIISKSKHLRVGIRWSGNSLYEDDLQRSVPFDKLEALAGIKGVQLYSLQRDDGVEMIHSSSRVMALHDKLETIEDALGAIANLDLVITSCTSIAHLAAAFGKETWIVLPFMPYYMWARPGKKSNWYQSVTLYRKSDWQSWDATTDEVYADLYRRVVAPTKKQ